MDIGELLGEINQIKLNVAREVGAGDLTWIGIPSRRSSKEHLVATCFQTWGTPVPHIGYYFHFSLKLPRAATVKKPSHQRTQIKNQAHCFREKVFICFLGSFPGSFHLSFFKARQPQVNILIIVLFTYLFLQIWFDFWDTKISPFAAIIPLDRLCCRQPRSQCLSSYRPLERAKRDGKMRDPGNEVVLQAFLREPNETGPHERAFSNSVRAKSVAKAKRSKECGAARVALATLFAPPELEKSSFALFVLFLRNLFLRKLTPCRGIVTLHDNPKR